MASIQETLNFDLPIKVVENGQEVPFHDLVLHKFSVDSVVMSLGDKITGDVYYIDNSLSFSMQEYVEYKGVKYYIVNPPTIVREGLVKDNGEAKGMTKYSFEFYHPMYMLGNFPFTDIAVTGDEERYLSQNKTFSWIGNLFEFIDKLNANLNTTQWVVHSNIAQYEEDEEDNVTETSEWQKASKLSEVLSFDKNFVSEALKKAYEEWEIPFVITSIASNETDYDNGKRFKVEFGLPTQEIYDSQGNKFIFRMGKGVGLKNNSRTPKNNKIVTRIVGSGSEQNIPYGYPQIVWTGIQSWDYTINNDASEPNSYPIYDGIVGGQKVRLIKHPFTRTTLMPSIYAQTVNMKVNPNAEGYNPNIEIIDYYDAVDDQYHSYPNNINPSAPSAEIHQFEDIKPELNSANELRLISVEPYETSNGVGVEDMDNLSTFLDDLNAKIEEMESAISQNNELVPQRYPSLEALKGLYSALITSSFVDYHASSDNGSFVYTCDATKKNHIYTVKFTSSNINIDTTLKEDGYTPSTEWDDTMDDDGNYVQSYFKVKLPQLDFDLYACASITEEMEINMRTGYCRGCTFPVQVDWDDYKLNFFREDGTFDPIIHTQEGDGHVRDGSKYPDSSQGQIEILLKKEIETFGTLMPNAYQQPQGESEEGENDGDAFVFLGISLPLSYITNGEERLDEAMKEYMLENNVYYYDYPLKFDEHFLTNNEYILSQIKNNNVVRFQYAGIEMALYIKQITVKYGDQALPTYDITLADDIEIVLNSVGQVTDDVSRMRVQLSEVQKYYSENLINAINDKLSRVSDDIAQGRITFQQGLNSLASAVFSDEIKSNLYDEGLYTGKGWRIDQLGNAEMETLRVRSFLEVVELLVNRVQAQEGDTHFTDNDQIDKVESVRWGNNQGYRLSFKEKYGGYVTSQQVGNILKGVINTLAAKQAGVSDVSINDTYYTSWMYVVATHTSHPNNCGVNQVVVLLYPSSPNVIPSGTNFPPCELMTVVRWGNTTNPALQSSFYLSTSEGRIVKLVGVNAPKLRPENYGTTLGELPQFVKDMTSIQDRVSSGLDYLYAQGIVVQDFIKIDREGLTLPEYVDDGEWDSSNTYLVNEYNENTMRYETSNVWHNGAYWRCLVHQDSTDYHEPSEANSAYWEKLLDSARINTKGTFKRHYANASSASSTGLSDMDIVLVDDSSDYVDPYGEHTGYASPTVMRWLAGFSEWQLDEGVLNDAYVKSSAGDADDGHLFHNNGTTWQDMGQFKGDKGDNGNSIREVSIYQWSDIKPTTPTSSNVPPTGWSLSSNASLPPLALNGGGDESKVVRRIDFYASKDNASFILDAIVSSEQGYDFLVLGKLNDDSLDDDDWETIADALHANYDDHEGATVGEDSRYGTYLTGDGKETSKQYTIPTKGYHYIWVAYVKDESNDGGGDYGEVSFRDFNDVASSMYLWCCKGTMTNNTLTSSWSEPIQMNGTDGEDGDDGKDALTIQLSKEVLTIACDKDGYSLPNPYRDEVQVKAFLGANDVTNSITLSNASSTEGDVSVSLDNTNKKVVVEVSKGTSLGVSTTINITFSVSYPSYTTRNITFPLTCINQGATGARGKIGRFFYYGGAFNSQDYSKTFPVNDAQAPYFSHISNNQQVFHVFNPEVPSRPSYTMAQMWSESGGSWNNKPWEVMTNDFKYIITEALFSQNAHLGSFIISGDWMISQHGILYDYRGQSHIIDATHSWHEHQEIDDWVYDKDWTVSNAFTVFDPAYPNSNKAGYNNFAPYYAVNGLTGEVYQSNAHIRGTIEAEDGKLRKLLLDAYGDDGGIYYGRTSDTDYLRVNPNAGVVGIPYNGLASTLLQANVQNYFKRARRNYYDRTIYAQGISEFYGRVCVSHDANDATGYSDNYAALVVNGGINNYGQFSIAVKEVTGDYTMTIHDHLIVCNSSNSITLTFANPTTDGQIFYIRNIGTGLVTLNPLTNTIFYKIGREGAHEPVTISRSEGIVTLIKIATNRWLVN